MAVSTAWGGYANGQIPLNAMVVVRGERFEPEAGAQLQRLESAFTARFGTPAIILEGYRSLARQQYLWQQWTSGVAGANRAAEPGTSNHGYGSAVDFASRIDLFDSAEHKWMVANAPTYGWHWGEAPTEAWHFTYYPGTATAGGGSTPIINGNTEDEEEEMKVGQVHYTAANGSIIRALFVPGTSYWLAWSEKGSDIANGFSVMLNTNGSVPVTEKMFAAMEAAAKAVS